MFLTDLAASRCRLDILEVLVDGPATGRELEQSLGHEPSTVRRNLKILRDDGWVERRDGANRVRGGRRFLVEELLKADRVISTYGENEGFWRGHDLSALPPSLLRDLDLLRTGRVVSGTAADPRRPLRVSREHMLDSSEAKVVSPSFAREYIEMHRRCAEDGIDVELILTHDAVEVAEEHPETVELWRQHCSDGGLSLYRGEGFRFVLVVGDDFAALNLPRAGEETIDLSNLFVAEGREAVEWGEQLFRHCRERSERFRI